MALMNANLIKTKYVLLEKDLYNEKNTQSIMNKIEIDKRFDKFAPYRSRCSGCAYLDLADFTCNAFPEGIPDKYLTGDDIHNKVVKRQKGDYVFTP